MAVELIPGGVDSLSSFSGWHNEYQLAGMIEPFAYPASEWKPIQDVPNSPGDCFSSTDALYRVWSKWMDTIVGNGFYYSRLQERNAVFAWMCYLLVNVPLAVSFGCFDRQQ